MIDEMLLGLAGVENARLCCPNCMGRSFRLVAVSKGEDMRWMCVECRREGRQSELVSAWPEGAMVVSDVKEKT